MENHNKPYGEEYENTIIAAMATLIVLSFIGVAVLWKKFPPFCDTANYTYCGDEPKIGEHH